MNHCSCTIVFITGDNMKKQTILYKGMYLLYTILNAIMYLANAMSYIQLNKYKDSSFPYKNAFLVFIYIIVEIFALVLLSSSTTKYSTPFQKLYYRKLRIAYFPYFLLIGLRFVTLNTHHKSAGYIYISVLTLLALLSTFIYLHTFRSCKSLVQNDTEKCNKLLNEYSIKLSEDELSIMKKIKRSILILFSLFIVSSLFVDTISSNKFVFLGFTIAYMVAVYLTLVDIFRFYYQKTYYLLNVLNALLCGIGCLFVWLVLNNIIKTPILSNRTPEELAIFLLIFMLPCLIWLSSKYKRYQRYNINQRADNFLQNSKNE